MSGFFEAPAYKLNVSDLLESKLLGGEGSPWTLKLTTKNLTSSLTTDADSSEKARKSLLPHKETTLILSMIWIQGTVVKILPGDSETDPSSLEVEDDTGSALVFGYLSLPGGDHPQITEGSYIAVLGQIWSKDPDLVIKGSKIMCLVDKPLLAKAWKDEVSAAKALLLNILVPTLDT